MVIDILVRKSVIFVKTRPIELVKVGFNHHIHQKRLTHFDIHCYDITTFLYISNICCLETRKELQWRLYNQVLVYIVHGDWEIQHLQKYVYAFGRMYPCVVCRQQMLRLMLHMRTLLLDQHLYTHWYWWRFVFFDSASGVEYWSLLWLEGTVLHLIYNSFKVDAVISVYFLLNKTVKTRLIELDK